MRRSSPPPTGGSRAAPPSAVGSVLFRRQLPPHMLLIDHILWSNLFPLQHTVQRREAILEALFRISEGYWFSPAELIMTSLFHFEDKVYRRGLSRVESTPLLFSRLPCQVLEKMGFPDEPRLERRRDSAATLTVDWWRLLPRSVPLPTQGRKYTALCLRKYTALCFQRRHLSSFLFLHLTRGFKSM